MYHSGTQLVLQAGLTCNCCPVHSIQCLPALHISQHVGELYIFCKVSVCNVTLQGPAAAKCDAEQVDHKLCFCILLRHQLVVWNFVLTYADLQLPYAATHSQVAAYVGVYRLPQQHAQAQRTKSASKCHSSIPVPASYASHDVLQSLLVHCCSHIVCFLSLPGTVAALIVTSLTKDLLTAS